MKKSLVGEIDKKLKTKPSGEISTEATCPKCQGHTFFVKRDRWVIMIECLQCDTISQLVDCWKDYELHK